MWSNLLYIVIKMVSSLLYETKNKDAVLSLDGLAWEVEVYTSLP